MGCGVIRAMVKSCLALALLWSPAADAASSKAEVEQVELKCSGQFAAFDYPSGSMDFPLYLAKRGQKTLGFTISAANILSAVWDIEEEYSSSYKLQFSTNNEALNRFGLQPVPGMKTGSASLDRESGEIYMRVEHDRGVATFTGTCAKPKMQF